MKRFFSFLGLGAALAVGACGGSDQATEGDEPEITSNDADVLEISFRGSVLGTRGENAKKAIASQLMYLQGALTTDVRGNAQAGMPSVLGLRDEAEGGKQRIEYEVKIAAAFPKGVPAPARYDIVLPLDTTALGAFNAKYDGRCGQNEYGQETFWHDWNPKASGCTIEDADVLRVSAEVKPHPQKTAGKYPEYDKIWEDDALDVVAVFGIIESNTPNDEGARGREQLLSAVQRSIPGAQRTDAAARAGVIADSTVSGSISVAGRPRRVNVTGILVQEVSSAGSAFNQRFAEVTAGADLVIYEGHSGLGKNINTLGSNMGAKPGKYQLVYFYGCQTLAYLGPDMHGKRAALNGAADPEGTKFLDVIATSLPAYGDNGRSTQALYEALLRGPSEPKTFNDLLETISSLHLAVVFGEHDNTFHP